ncbi:MAG TPA: sigma 54-interacting transcriptional regulator [Edaphobacter sp.]|nr:sigma 54-interacting transcriptional regulator [Edaphobacter sp.]
MAHSDPFAASGIVPACFETSGFPDSLDEAQDLSCLLGDGDAMRRLRLQIERLGPHFRTVLVRGKTGTGKELVARALHSKSAAEGPFVICQAARFAELEEKERDGGLTEMLMEKATRGTLFLDGVEEMPAGAQRRLLSMLEQRPSFRTIASTSHDLRVMAAAGIFRQDLYHRLAMVEMVLDPLRRRPEDIPALAIHFLERFSSRYRRPIDAIAHDAMEKLLVHEWPGNVRELDNVLHNAVLQCEDTVLGSRDLSLLTEVADQSQSAEHPRSETQMRLQDVIDRHVLRVLEECSGNKVRAAEVLGISRSTLYRMLEGSSEQGAGGKV